MKYQKGFFIMNNKHKKILIILGISFGILVIGIASTLIVVNHNRKKAEEKARLEKLEELEQQEAEKQRLEEEKEKLEQQARDNEWANMESSQPYFQLGSEHLNRKQAIPGWYEYTYDEAFIGTLYMIQGGWFNGASAEDLSQILNTALNNLPDNASSKEVYDALVDFASKYPHDRWVTGVGNSPMGEEHNTPQPKPNNNSNGNSNNNSNSNNNNSNSGNKKPSNNTGNNNSGNNNSNNNNSSSNNNDDGPTSGFIPEEDGWTDGSDDTDWDKKGDIDLDINVP